MLAGPRAADEEAMEPTTAPAFDAAFAAVADVDGWLTESQARRLWDAAGACPPGGRIVEIGSFRGRSAIVLARAAADGTEVIAIDPHIGTDRGPQEIVTTDELGSEDHEAFVANLARAGVTERVRHVRERSDDAHPFVDDPIDVLYIDGAHRFGPARSDLTGWGVRVRDGGTLLIHDAWSSIGVTLALLTTLVPSTGWRYLGRTGSLAAYRKEPVAGGERVRNVARQVGELAWFARNVVIKVLLTCRLGRATRLLGHDGETWPY